LSRAHGVFLQNFFTSASQDLAFSLNNTSGAILTNKSCIEQYPGKIVLMGNRDYLPSGIYGTVVIPLQ
jgi:hypothetical protein